MIFNLTLTKYEAQSEKTAIADSDTFKDALLEELGETDDYIMYIYGTGTSIVQKRTLDKASFYFDFNGSEYGDLDGKKYIINNDIIYELGQSNKAYYTSSAEYAPLLEKLTGYSAAKYCAQGAYTEEACCFDQDGDDVCIIYGDGVTIVNYSGGYYEKTGDRLSGYITKITRRLQTFRRTATLRKLNSRLNSVLCEIKE